MAEDLRNRGIVDERVLEVIASLRRSDFVDVEQADQATGDFALPIGHGQTISQPYVVALMTQALALHGQERVLEIGTGSGYQTAVLSFLCRAVYSIEIIPALAASAARRLQHRRNVALKVGDGHQGWPEAGPFDAVLLTAAPLQIPAKLISQCRVGGRIVAPVGAVDEVQLLVRLTPTDTDRLVLERLLPVRFVPMTGLASEG